MPVILGVILWKVLNYGFSYINKYRDYGKEGTKHSLEGSTDIERLYISRGRS